MLGTAEVMAAVFAGADVGLAQVARFLVVTTLGNTLGGVVFVGIVKYAHASVVRAPPRLAVALTGAGAR